MGAGGEEGKLASGRTDPASDDQYPCTYTCAHPIQNSMPCLFAAIAVLQRGSSSVDRAKLGAGGGREEEDMR